MITTPPRGRLCFATRGLATSGWCASEGPSGSANRAWDPWARRRHGGHWVRLQGWTDRCLVSNDPDGVTGSTRPLAHSSLWEDGIPRSFPLNLIGDLADHRRRFLDFPTGFVDVIPLKLCLPMPDNDAGGHVHRVRISPTQQHTANTWSLFRLRFSQT